MTPIIDSDVSHMKNLDLAKLDPQFINIKNRDQAEVDKVAAEFQNIFTKADKDGDSLLNRDEYLAFCAMQIEASEARGKTVPQRTDDQLNTMYTCVKIINPETDGASALDVAAAHIFYANCVMERLDPHYIPAEVKELFAPIIKNEIEKMQAWDDDQRGLAWEFAESRRHGSEKEKADAEFKDFFTKCDTNNDKLLQQDEYHEYAELYRTTKEARGEPDTPKTKEDIVKFYEAVNKIQPEVDGLSENDIVASHNYIYSNIKKGILKSQ